MAGHRWTILPYRTRQRAGLASLLLTALLLLLLWRLRGLRESCVPGGLEPRLDPDEKKQLLDLLDAFVRAATDARVPFFLSGGTLLGSWRHHGLVPWDDDLYLTVPHNLRDNLSRALRALGSDHALYGQAEDVRWKWYSVTSGTRINATLWSFPYIDISFYLLSETRLWDYDTANWWELNFPRGDVLPLTSRPFEGRWLPVPRDVRAVLERTFDLSLCLPARFSHRLEAGVGQHCGVPCVRVADRVALVSRVALGKAVGEEGARCVETLVQNGTVMGDLILQDLEC